MSTLGTLGNFLLCKLNAYVFFCTLDAGDVSLSLQLVTLEPNSSTYTFNDFIEVIGDMLVEGNESISVMFTPVNELDMIQGSPLTFTIIDDDGTFCRVLLGL